MSTRTFKIGTRGSDLALWQARRVQALLSAARPGVSVEIEIIDTRGDRDTSHVLYRPSPGATGVFTKAIEQALLEKRVDIAVHSLKDLPTESPDGLDLGATPERVDAHDLWITRDGSSLEQAPAGAHVGTSSLRRRAQIAAVRSDLVFEDIRGNVPRRLQLLADGEYHAILLAAAGLARLGKRPPRAVPLPLDQFLPAPGQGALAVQIRTEDEETEALVQTIDDARVRLAVLAERAFLRTLEGGCTTPIGALAEVVESRVNLRGLVVHPSGNPSVRGDRSGDVDLPAAASTEPALRRIASIAAESIGAGLAQELLGRGAGDLIERTP